MTRTEGSSLFRARLSLLPSPLAGYLASVSLAAVLAAVLVAAPARAEKAGEIERLPASVRPAFQSIALTLDPSRKEYAGTTRIDVRVSEAREEILFHAQKLDLRRTTLKGKGGAYELKTTEGEDGLVRAARVDGHPIAPGSYTIEIEFANDFDERATSLYRLQVDGDWYAFSQFQAVDARFAFPCFDEPSFKFPYQLTLTVPAGVEAVTNTPIEKETRRDDGRTIVFRRTKPLPSYLLAIALGPLEFTPVSGTSIPTRIVTVKGKRHLTNAVVAMTPPILSALERYFGRRYPYEKLDLIAVPEYTYGAMENPGAITYTDQSILFDEKTMTVSQRRTLVRFTAHEFAHMWFGDLVTMSWWNDLWLNESFAEWLGDKIGAQVYPELETTVIGLEDTQKAYDADARLTARPIRHEVKSTGNLLQMVDALTYQKGQSVLGMMEQWLGEETFRRGVMAYMKKHEWGNTVESDLWSALSKASGRDVASVGETFFNQPGIPLVEVELLGGARVKLRQSRFLNHGLRDSVERSWRIPVTLKYPTPRGVKTWSTLLVDREATVTLPGVTETPAWLLPNAEETGYYRWTLAGEAMGTLAKDSKRILSPRERYAYLLNAFALLQGGTLPGVDYMRLLASFGDDPHPAVVDAVVDGIFALDAYFVGEDLRDPYALYVRRVLSPALDRIGLDAKPGESPTTTSLRPALFRALADFGRDEELRAYARAAAERYLRGEDVEASMVGPVLRVAAFEGDAKFFDALQERFENVTVPGERGRLLGALGAFRDPALRARALEYTFSGKLKPQEHYTIVQSVGVVPEQQDEVWAWAAKNYDRMIAALPPFYVIYYPWMASGCSQERLDSAKAFFAGPAHAPPGTETELKKMAATVVECIGLREREGPAVRDYLLKGMRAP
jgi:alanyl aminopeptidase